MSDSDFRARVQELREKLMAQVQGAILNRFSELTGPEAIKKLEIIDLGRIWDRVTMGSKPGVGSPVIGNGEGRET